MIITPYTHQQITKLTNAVFLAGPCPRVDYEIDWRNEAIEILNHIGFKGDIIVPTNPQYDGNLTKQTLWEYKALRFATHILFWIPRSKKHPAFTTNIEFGEWFDKPNVVVGFPIDSEKNEYLEERLKMCSKQVYNTLLDTCLAVYQNSKRESKVFFTSDTHFGAKRTLELSCRPFMNVEEMNLKMISNWNKTVLPQDIVYHLGDIGDLNIVKLLNFAKMNLIVGNYEKNDEQFQEKIINNFGNKVSLLTKQKVTILGKDYCLTHEPIDNNDENEFYLYGHIHRNQLVKRNGINVGVDLHNFKPVSKEEINFLRNAIENYYDENVFSDKCF